VCLAFDLNKGNLTNSDNLTLLLLFLNTLRWLLPPDPVTPQLVSTGEAFFLPPGAAPASLRLLPPRGAVRVIETDTVEVDHVGEYRLGGSRYRAVLYANLFDEMESDIARREEDTPVAQPTSESPPAPQELTRTVPHEFGRSLYYGAALVLILEWLYAMWRYSRTGAP
jgi:hypothetical protein